MKRIMTMIFMLFSAAITIAFLEGVGILRIKILYLILGIYAFRYVLDKE